MKRDRSTLLTSIGSITYHKTLFSDKQSGQTEYLLDRCMGLEKHARMTEDAEAAVLMEAVESIYRKGGEHAGISKVSDEGESRREKLGELTDLPVYSIPYTQIKKIASLKNHIWGL